jgi:transcriptional regulator NrdR family protein
MVCIYCSGDLAVTNSRPQLSRNQTWRRRLCKACGAVFTSTESIDLSQALVVQDSGQKNAKSVAKKLDLQPFDRDRLFISIYESLRHRPTAAQDARGLADTVTAQLIKSGRTLIPHGLISNRTIAEHVISTLQRFDKAAATHYAAFHK